MSTLGTLIMICNGFLLNSTQKSVFKAYSSGDVFVEIGAKTLHSHWSKEIENAVRTNKTCKLTSSKPFKMENYGRIN